MNPQPDAKHPGKKELKGKGGKRYEEDSIKKHGSVFEFGT
jgi:hypothetical protein